MAAFHRVILVFVCGVSVISCHVGLPLRELGYHASLPEATPASFETAKQFAAAVERNLDLKTVSDVTPAKGIPGGVCMKGPNLGVDIFAKPSLHALDIVVRGDIDSDSVKDIVVAIQELFGRVFPGQRIAPYVRKQGLFAP